MGIDLWKPNSPAARWKQAAIAQYFDLFDLVGIRHLPDESYEGWQNAKSAGTLFHCGDWALRLPTDGDPSIAVDRKQVFITLREHAIEVVPHGYIAAVEALIDQVRSHGFSPILLPFCPEDERFLAEMGLERLAPVERTWWNPRRVRQWIASSGAMLTVGRLHPLIFSAGTGTPVASVTLSGIGGLLNRQPGKLMVATRELGIVSISNAQELSAFLARPLPADPEKVMASRQRLDMMIDRLKDHFQVAP